MKDCTEKYNNALSEEKEKINQEYENDGYLSEEQLNDLPRYLPIIKKEEWLQLPKDRQVFYKYLYLDSKKAVDAYNHQFGLDKNNLSAVPQKPKP